MNRRPLTYELYRDRLLSENQIDRIFRLLVPCLVILPRTQLSYAFYCFAGVLVWRYSADFLKKTFIMLGTFVALLIMSSLVHDVSWVAAGVELILIFPFAFFCFAGTARQFNVSHFRFISLVVALASLYSLVQQGFPFRLPYLDFLPDAYWGVYGLGGARWVCVIGFFCLLAELISGRRNIFWMVLASLNFIMPSYLIGFFCGLACFIFLLKGSLVIRFLTVIIVAPILMFVCIYAYQRLLGLNIAFLETYGLHPKLYALVTIFEMFLDNVEIIFTGTGIGQFSSTAAIWSNDMTRLYSGNAIPSIQGFYPSELQTKYMDPIYLAAGDSKWLLSSSLNKPYSSLLSIIAEFGLFGLFLIYLLLKRISYLTLSRRYKLGLIVFILLLFLLDTWHDNPLIFTLLAMIEGLSRRIYSERIGYEDR